jgi:hypothetical protein
MILLAVLATAPVIASAHASGQGFVLLLPTDIYITAGAATVALTVTLLFFLPDGAVKALYTPHPFLRLRALPLHHLASCLAAGFLGILIWAGFAGPHDPLRNPLPVMFWAVWWIALVGLQGLIGNHWRWSNPFTGPYALFVRLTGRRAVLRYPHGLGHAPGILSFLGFAGFLMADIAPSDPPRLAMVLAVYWCFTLLGLVVFGRRWLLRGEGITILMRAYGRMSIFARGHAGLPGWQILARGPVPVGLGIFALVMLGSGSFDGLNETFWWLGQLGINPLEFPGRSAVIAQNLLGLVAANLALIAGFTACIWLGAWIIGEKLRPSFCLFAPTILPIALAYHLAHYLASALVDGQYALKLVRNYLGLGDFHVTTGFFYTPHTVKMIWLSQAGLVVAGHVIAILLAHALALRAYGSSRRALFSQVPLVLFMVLYTVFGLWLLASPRGV